MFNGRSIAKGMTHERYNYTLRNTTTNKQGRRIKDLTPRK